MQLEKEIQIENKKPLHSLLLLNKNLQHQPFPILQTQHQ